MRKTRSLATLAAATALAFALGCATTAPAPSAGPAAPVPSAVASPEAPPSSAAPSSPSPAQYLAPTPFAGGDGSSVDQAVVVLAEAEDEGIDLEHHWIFDHYGRFRKIRGGLASADGRHFDVITVELGDHSEKTIYFDITGFYGVLEKPAPDPAPPPPPFL